jgi:hypothetical protein
MDMHAGTGHHFSKAGGEGEVHVWGGIVSARLSDLAEALGTGPEKLMDAADREGITPMVDTATPAGRSDSEDDRPTDPALRSVAFAREDVARLRDKIEAEAPDTVPA